MAGPEGIPFMLLLIMVFGTLMSEGLPTSTMPDDLTVDYVKQSDREYKIAAFNIKIFGATKAGKQPVMEDLAEIIAEFDMTFIQEIREVTDIAITTLMDLLNSKHGGGWEYVQSGRFGRTSSKEQYACVYKKSKVEIMKTYTYDDSAHDYFEREPYGVQLRFILPDGSKGKPIGVICLHVKPTDALAELTALRDVYDVAKSHLNTEDILLMGDFNADCSYLSAAAMRTLVLRTDKRFTWLIGDDEDTTVAGNKCAYDRIVYAGNRVKKMVAGGTGLVYRFDQILGLSTEEADERSDHYPVYLSLYEPGSGSRLVCNPLLVLLTCLFIGLKVCVISV